MLLGLMGFLPISLSTTLYTPTQGGHPEENLPSVNGQEKHIRFAHTFSPTLRYGGRGWVNGSCRRFHPPLVLNEIEEVVMCVRFWNEPVN